MATQLWALTSTGDIVRFTSVDMASAERVGKIMVRTGAWKTWDAFDDAAQPDEGRKWVASHAAGTLQGVARMDKGREVTAET